MVHIGKHIKKESKRFGLTQDELAKRTGKSVSGVRKDFAKKEMTPTLMAVYSKALGINLFEVLAKDFETGLQGEVTLRPKDTKETISFTITVDADNKQKILKLLQQ